MIDGFKAVQIPQESGEITEIHLTDLGSEPDAMTGSELTVLLVTGPPDPVILPELLPAEVFERARPIHVGALTRHDDNLLYSMLDLIEVMNENDIAVFLCEDQSILNEASLLLLGQA